MSAPTEESTRLPETQLPISTEEYDDDRDRYLPELPLEEDPEETALEEEPAAPADDQASFDTFAALSELPHDLSARRPDRFLLRLVVQEIVTLVVLALAVLALAHFKVWRFPLLAREVGSILGLTTPAAQARTPDKVPPSGATPVTRAAAGQSGQRAETAHVAPRVAPVTPSQARRDLGALPAVVPDAFGMYVEEASGLTPLEKHEKEPALFDSGPYVRLIERMRTLQTLPRVQRSFPRFLLFSEVARVELIALYRLDTFDKNTGMLHWSVVAGPVRSHPNLYRIEVPFSFEPGGTYALGISQGFTDAGHHVFWPFRVE